jgi:hypothetical protein
MTFNFTFLAVAVLAASMISSARADEHSTYAIVVSSQTIDDDAWCNVVNALTFKHSARWVTFDKHVDETLARLKDPKP